MKSARSEIQTNLSEIGVVCGSGVDEYVNLGDITNEAHLNE